LIIAVRSVFDTLTVEVAGAARPILARAGGGYQPAHGRPDTLGISLDETCGPAT
jgi:hypothetical protein